MRSLGVWSGLGLEAQGVGWGSGWGANRGNRGNQSMETAQKQTETMETVELSEKKKSFLFLDPQMEFRG